MNLDVAIVDLTNGYGGAGLALSHHLGIPAVGFASQSPETGLWEFTVLKGVNSIEKSKFQLSFACTMGHPLVLAKLN